MHYSNCDDAGNDKFFWPTGDFKSPNKKLMLKSTKLRFPNEKTLSFAAKTIGQELRYLPTMQFRRIFLILAACPALSGSIASAALLTVQVDNGDGLPIADAVVYAEPVSGQSAPKAPRHRVEIVQKHRTFLPLVTAIQAGAEISFPNHDTVRHHVYSFSPAKNFEIKLRDDIAGSPPVLFDKPGTVVVGCNIHDEMVAYIHVVNTPYFAKTNASGKARIGGLPPGKYLLKAWHFNLPSGTPIPQQDLGMEAGEASAVFKLNLKPGSFTH